MDESTGPILTGHMDFVTGALELGDWWTDLEMVDREIVR